MDLISPLLPSLSLQPPRGTHGKAPAYKQTHAEKEPMLSGGGGSEREKTHLKCITQRFIDLDVENIFVICWLLSRFLSLGPKFQMWANTTVYTHTHTQSSGLIRYHKTPPPPLCACGLSIMLKLRCLFQSSSFQHGKVHLYLVFVSSSSLRKRSLFSSSSQVSWNTHTHSKVFIIKIKSFQWKLFEHTVSMWKFLS